MSLVNAIRRSEYTGANRCWPCTIVNSAIAVLLSALVAIGLRSVVPTARALLASGLFLAVAAGAIWLRGYLIPKTPQLTERYAPSWVLRRFGKAPSAPRAGASGTGIRAGELLEEAAVVEPCDRTDDLRLTDRFEAAWQTELSKLSEDVVPSDAIDALGFDPATVRVDRFEDAAVLVSDDRPVLQWPSEVAVRIDVAGARALSAEWAGWEDRTPLERCRLLETVRVFATACPDGSPVELNEREVESCCSTERVVTIECSGSGAPILERPID